MDLFFRWVDVLSTWHCFDDQREITGDRTLGCTSCRIVPKLWLNDRHVVDWDWVIASAWYIVVYKALAAHWYMAEYDFNWIVH